MRPFHPYTPDQAALLPATMDEWVSPNDPVRVVREIVSGQLDLSAFLRAYETERGRPPYHPQAMVGLLLYGCCRGIVSSRRLAQACHQDISFRYLMGGLEPDYHTIIAFRKRFEQELKGLFYQVLLLCAAAGLVRLGHVSLDGTKVRANASKHKAMSYGRLLSKEEALEREIQGWFERARQEDAEDDERYGGDDDGFSLPEAMERAQTRLETLRLARVRLEREAREKAVAVGKPPDEAQVPEKAQTNFTDPESRIMHTPDGFQQCYNAQIVVDAESQVIVACEVSQAPPDVQRLVPMLEQIIALHGRSPGEMTPMPDTPRNPTSPPLTRQVCTPSSPYAATTAMSHPMPIPQRCAPRTAGPIATRCVNGWRRRRGRRSTGCASRRWSRSSGRSRRRAASVSSSVEGCVWWAWNGASSAPGITS